MKKITPSKNFDYPLLLGIIIIVLFGVIMVYDASVVYAENVFGGKYHMLLLQSMWVFVGIAGAAFSFVIGPQRLSKFSVILLFISIFLLGLLAWPRIPVLNLLIPHSFYDTYFPTIYGARRWLIIPGKMSLQPSELAKLSLVLYFSLWLTNKKRPVILFLLMLGFVTGLVLLEPDFGTAAVIMATGLSILFISGVNLFKFFASFAVVGILAVLLIVSSPYRMQRLSTYLNPSAADPQGEGYHITQILIALGSGGPTGVGFGQSRQKYDYIPEVSTDSIFAVVGEELGLVGTTFVVAAFLFVIARGYLVALRLSDMFSKLVAVGVTTWLAVQVLVNLLSMTALIPLTGVPLPLISYGGSSLLFIMVALGMLLSVSRQYEKR